MNRRKFLELSAWTTATASVAILPGCSSNKRSSGFSSAGLRQIHETMAGYVDRGAVPGLVWGVSRHGDPHVEALGARAMGGAPVRRDTIFRIASMTKPVTAVATMMLIEEGKLALDEPVDRLLPELANRRVVQSLEGPLDVTVPAARALTVRDLLAFTMGFGIVIPFDAYPVQRAMDELQLGYGPPQPQRPPAPDEWIRRFGTLPLMRQPGEVWMYNTGSDVLGVLIARASGRPFDAFLAERIFQPLGMNDTGFSIPASKLDRFTASYMVNEQTGNLDLYDGIDDSQWGRPPAFPSGAAGLVSTIDDYFAFGQMMLNRGRHGTIRILSEASVERMTTDQLTPQQKVGADPLLFDFKTRSWGYGVAVVTQPDDVSPIPGRYGWDGGLGTFWINDPARDFVGILLTLRTLGPGAPDHDFWKAAYRAMEV
jgi:CubicO group peptidase (beta-lactamase class C family)